MKQYLSTCLHHVIPLIATQQGWKKINQLLQYNPFHHLDDMLGTSSKYFGECNCQKYMNPLSANPTKWSNTLKQFVGISRQIVCVCLIILWDWRLKG